MDSQPIPPAEPDLLVSISENKAEKSSILKRGINTLFAFSRRHAIKILWANLVAQIAIIVTGGAVRLTGFGLGCFTWSMCEPGQFAPAFHEASSLHPYIEFGNRTLTGVLLIIAILVILAVWGEPKRQKSVRVLASTPLILVGTQGIIGGITVLVDLHPMVVGFHMMVSLLLVAVSTVLLMRYQQPDTELSWASNGLVRKLAWLLQIILLPVLVLGIIVTGAGPHSGDSEVGYRLSVDPALFSRYHALSVWAFVIVLLALIAALWLESKKSTANWSQLSMARKASIVLLLVTLMQGAIGYIQYFTKLPPLLVGAHMFGAGVLVAASVALIMSLTIRKQLVSSS